MLDQVIALIIDEGKWLTASMGTAIIAVSSMLYATRRAEVRLRPRVLAAMSLFFAVTIGMMAFGHLLAVTTKLLIGTLEGSLLVFYAIGVVLAVPSWWLIYQSQRALRGDGNPRTTLVLNSWLAGTLLLMGLHNAPLAAPGILNAGYQLNSNAVVAWTIVGLAVVVNVGLFIGSVIFLASGQSFEAFSGMQ